MWYGKRTYLWLHVTLVLWNIYNVIFWELRFFVPKIYIQWPADSCFESQFLALNLRRPMISQPARTACYTASLIPVSPRPLTHHATIKDQRTIRLQHHTTLFETNIYQTKLGIPNHISLSQKYQIILSKPYNEIAKRCVYFPVCIVSQLCLQMSALVVSAFLPSTCR